MIPAPEQACPTDAAHWTARIELRYMVMYHVMYVYIYMVMYYVIHVYIYIYGYV